ncbi:xaa-Pro aminopeptidase 1-like [Diaphorina citri]|uniref:Xaa-Pro aminopeptidase 1-like n=1 Tax=Diaphorina citri TaxID=121845 RepID=A0A3Q0JD84_DIACI|nr:xaa-Pro aminopeptidase 1-like [Diaphorina citri]
MAICCCLYFHFIQGHAIDAIARHNLWSVGLDYLHGTGHGIGSYLNVHEGPISVSYLPKATDSGILADMFISDEPGYYEDGKFGIRIENIVQVIPAETKYSRKNKTFLTFKTITLVPIQTSLLCCNMLTADEVSRIEYTLFILPA